MNLTGRAWIFMALNECLLESYIRNISGDARRLKKYYVKEALLLDQQVSWKCSPFFKACVFLRYTQ